MKTYLGYLLLKFCAELYGWSGGIPCSLKWGHLSRNSLLDTVRDSHKKRDKTSSPLSSLLFSAASLSRGYVRRRCKSDQDSVDSVGLIESDSSSVGRPEKFVYMSRFSYWRLATFLLHAFFYPDNLETGLIHSERSILLNAKKKLYEKLFKSVKNLSVQSK